MYAFAVFNYTLNMKIKDIKDYPEDKLRKYFDELDRIVRIDFLESGNSCNIMYVGDTTQKSTVTWSNGYTYIHNPDGTVIEAKAN